jgi:hypothetical protein
MRRKYEKWEGGDVQAEIGVCGDGNGTGKMALREWSWEDGRLGDGARKIVVGRWG